ncbi:flavin reductase family protein [Dactylosporangium aurantiacum]|uniref:flavin reductase family protein n=1 Tax=Dactylosporangium aurantiacum TaxID=35754 RepID=UPI0028C40392|nr:flavin reductase family protein [Dactylosporangium aurantiacum]
MRQEGLHTPVIPDNELVSIHATDPFATPDDQRSPLRRLRGRLPAPVTLWTAGGGDTRPAGLTVSSMLVADGDPGRVAGLVDDESDLWTALETTGRFAVVPLAEGDNQLAERFAGLMPAPGGLFATGDWAHTPFGPVPRGYPWAGCRLDRAAAFGWSLLVEATVEVVEPAEPAAKPLLHHRGRYTSI